MAAVVTPDGESRWRLPARKTIESEAVGPDHRRWRISRTAEWVTPDMGETFQVDITGSVGGRVFVGGGLVFLWVLLGVGWWGSEVHVPGYFWWAPVILVVLVPSVWWLRRPWSIVAQTDGFGEIPGERLTAVVRGRREAFRTVAGVTEEIVTTGRVRAANPANPAGTPVPPAP